MIEVNNLSYSYPASSNLVLKNISFQISQGEIFGFLGPSGAGKSTCQKILYKILGNFDGEISIGGKGLENWGKEYFERIGVGFELPNHYEKLTAKENLELFRSFYPREKCTDIKTLLEIVGLSDNMNDRVETFSKGMKMRLNYVRAIMHNPELLFFDEPTAGLDPINARKILNHIQALKQKGKTIFITTHNMTTADELCDRVSFIVDGELIITESPQTLKHQYGKENVKVQLKNGESEEFRIKQLGQNESFLSFIRDQEILKIHTQEASLEQVFLQVTGKALIK